MHHLEDLSANGSCDRLGVFISVTNKLPAQQAAAPWIQFKRGIAPCSGAVVPACHECSAPPTCKVDRSSGTAHLTMRAIVVTDRVWTHLCAVRQ